MGSPISLETFLVRARERFGDRYDYSGIVYKSYKTPIRISCRQHPVRQISITPEKHLQTTGGCKYCLRDYRIRALERELNREPVERPDSPSKVRLSSQAGLVEGCSGPATVAAATAQPL